MKTHQVIVFTKKTFRGKIVFCDDLKTPGKCNKYYGNNAKKIAAIMYIFLLLFFIASLINQTAV
jgi:hypothetical protein